VEELGVFLCRGVALSLLRGYMEHHWAVHVPSRLEQKNQLFRTVICDGALPRKTFSMGHAEDKRYYIECRRIK